MTSKNDDQNLKENFRFDNFVVGHKIRTKSILNRQNF